MNGGITHDKHTNVAHTSSHASQTRHARYIRCILGTSLLHPRHILVTPTSHQAYHVDINEDSAGCKFKMDPYFFLTDFNPGIAWTLLREAATKCKVMFLHTENSREWSYTRATEIMNSLQQGDAVVSGGGARTHRQITSQHRQRALQGRRRRPKRS